MHVHCLHWLMSTGLLFQGAFCQPCKSITGEMAPIIWRAPDWQWGPDMAPTVSARLSKPCSGLLAFLGTCTSQSYSKLYYVCHLTPVLLPPTPYICWANINEFHEKNIKN